MIRKVGDQYCVFSKDGNKNLGCYATKDGATKRLQEIEFFKHSKGKNMLNEDIFENFKLGDSKTPEQSNLGTIAGLPSEKLLDKKEHFAVITPDQAKSSLNRVMKLTKAPDWFAGTIDELKYAVYAGIKEAHPTLNFQVLVPVATALSDGQTPSETQKSDLKDPNDVAPKHVKEVKRPTLAEVWNGKTDAEVKALANHLVMMLEKQQEHLEKAMELAQRLLSGGLSGKEFEKLSTYLQEDILRNLMQCGVMASRKQELINKLSK